LAESTGVRRLSRKEHGLVVTTWKKVARLVVSSRQKVARLVVSSRQKVARLVVKGLSVTTGAVWSRSANLLSIAPGEEVVSLVVGSTRPATIWTEVVSWDRVG
jgi:hypothetical protein